LRQLVAGLRALALDGHVGEGWQEPDVAAAAAMPVPSVLPPGGFARVAERPVAVCHRRAALLRRLGVLQSGKWPLAHCAVAASVWGVSACVPCSPAGHAVPRPRDRGSMANCRAVPASGSCESPGAYCPLTGPAADALPVCIHGNKKSVCVCVFVCVRVCEFVFEHDCHFSACPSNRCRFVIQFVLILAHACVGRHELLSHRFIGACS
jgi:hypothetical protein